MKKRLILVLIVAVLAFIPAVALGQQATAPKQPSVSIVGGFRLHHDMFFYLQGGVIADGADVMLDVGMNNSVWIGAHKYLYTNEAQTVSAFSGFELHVFYPTGSTIEFHPALPFGVAARTGMGMFYVEMLILPSQEGKPVDLGFALSFLFPIWSVGGK